MVMVMFKFASAAVFLLGSVALAAAAAPQCLAPNEIEAEQAIRFQAELMVVSDTCGAQTYTQFARRNRTTLVAYQQQVIDRFRRDGTAHAEAKFDSYLTRLANEVSLRTGAQPVAAMCRDAASFLATAESLVGGDEFRHYIAQQAATHRADYRRCSN
jgi:hypothetical protein